MHGFPDSWSSVSPSLTGIITSMKNVLLTFQSHANLKTLLKSAERTPFPLSFINAARLVFCTDVLLVVLDRPFEKALQVFMKKKDLFQHFITSTFFSQKQRCYFCHILFLC